MVQIFIEGLKTGIKNEMIKTLCYPLPRHLTEQKKLEKHAEQKAVPATQIKENSIGLYGLLIKPKKCI
jgi:hypothetical protein